VPSAIPSEPAWSDAVDGSEDVFQFLSPIYDNLDTNIPYTLMGYSDHPFPDGTSLFPRHEVVQEYLERYADEVRHLLRLGIQVLDVRPITDNRSGDKWSVFTKNLRTGETSVSLYDAVIVANGHYNDPYVPNIPGIREWNTAYPGSISHSKFYKRPDDFRDKVGPPQTYIFRLLSHQ
jgi:cation diffusion facilitator CzcD-associated flavoprotein CzcO